MDEYDNASCYLLVTISALLQLCLILDFALMKLPIP
jgi:hypothetical protein